MDIKLLIMLLPVVSIQFHVYVTNMQTFKFK
jgi:hypothetical protein